MRLGCRDEPGFSEKLNEMRRIHRTDSKSQRTLYSLKTRSNEMQSRQGIMLAQD
jgi:hypothetical protein